MLNFTVGPVTMEEPVRELGAQQLPYFRTGEFSAVMLENEALLKKLAGAEESARAVFLTGSGTAAMEAAVMNVFDTNDRVLVVNGGSFGQRFAELCRIHEIPYEEIKLSGGRTLRREQLESCAGKGFTGFLINMHETSTGVLYDMEMVGRFCRENRIFLVVDAISSFLADPFHMAEMGAQLVIVSSQKALACPPGISALLLSERAVKRIENRASRSMYFDIRAALRDGRRGQTPFTPAVGILLQIHARLRAIEARGGAQSEIDRTAALAKDFRQKISGLPFTIFSEALSNAVTPLHPVRVSAYGVFQRLKEEYGIWVCPNGGELEDSVFRVGHLGMLTAEDNTRLAAAFRDLEKRGLL